MRTTKVNITEKVVIAHFVSSIFTRHLALDVLSDKRPNTYLTFNITLAKIMQPLTNIYLQILIVNIIWIECKALVKREVSNRGPADNNLTVRKGNFQSNK